MAVQGLRCAGFSLDAASEDYSLVARSELHIATAPLVADHRL